MIPYRREQARVERIQGMGQRIIHRTYTWLVGAPERVAPALRVDRRQLMLDIEARRDSLLAEGRGVMPAYQPDIGGEE